jgi:integrative and conjugative element protein (TIGR02256 family)
VIACAGDPGPRARHRPYLFEADRAHTQRLINRIHQKSKGTYRFLGSWHSHPGTSRTPSKRDGTTAQEIAADSRVDLSEPLVLIISQVLSAFPNGDHIEAVCCYSWSKLERRLIQSLLMNTRVLDRFC